MAKTFTATARDGQTFTRTSKTKTYTHAVMVEAGSTYIGCSDYVPVTGPYSWASRLDLAHKALAKAQRFYPEAYLVEVS